MRGHNICFNVEIRKIIPNLSSTLSHMEYCVFEPRHSVRELRYFIGLEPLLFANMYGACIQRHKTIACTDS